MTRLDSRAAPAGGAPGHDPLRRPRVGYVMSRFPHLPETFILREMSALRAAGWDLRLYPLMRQPGQLVHAEAVSWVQRAQYLSRGPVALLAANVRELLRAPAAYLGLWSAVLRDCRREPDVLLRSLALLPACVLLAGLVRRDRVEHLHAHYATYPLLAAWTAHRLTGVSYSVTVHAHDLFVSQAMLVRKLERVAFVAAISDHNREFLAQRVDEGLRGRTHVVHCGVDPAAYTAPRHPRSTALEVLSIGSLQPYKGQAQLVEACALLVQRGVHVRCRIVGGGPERGRLQARIDAADLQDVVLLLGPRVQEEVAALLSSASCYAQPSVVAADGQMEGIPVALMEAMASGLPVVATDLSGVPELVRHGDTGWLVPPGDATALADALQAVATDPAGAAVVASRGRRMVEQQFDLAANVEQLAQLFRRTGDHTGDHTGETAEVRT